MRHDCEFVAAITEVVFFLAAVLYVDGTDLLVQAKYPVDLDVKFIQLIQKAVDDWGHLVQATGGSRRNDMLVSMHSFFQGKAVLKKAHELPAKTILIPQQDGTMVPIPVINSETLNKTLGVLTNTARTGNDHLMAIRKKGIMACSDSLRSDKFLQPSDGYLSLNIQLKPKMQWGLVCMSTKLDDVDISIHDVYHISLNCFQVNQKMRKELCMLPKIPRAWNA